MKNVITDVMITNIVVVRENPRYAVILSWMGFVGVGTKPMTTGGFNHLVQGLKTPPKLYSLAASIIVDQGEAPKF